MSAIQGFWTWLTENFNNREIAGGFWLLAILMLGLLSKSIRTAIGGLIRAALSPKLLVIFLAFGGYVAGLAWLYEKIDIWSESQVTATIVWYLLSGISLLARSIHAKEGGKHFQKYARDAISIIGVVEFVYVFETCSLVVEIIMTPILAVVGIFYAFSERDPKHAPVRKLTEWVLAIVVMVFLWKSISVIWNTPERFWNIDTARSFALPIVLTIGSIPIFYLMYCYSELERANIRLNLKNFQPPALQRYAKWRFFRSFALRPWLLMRATRQFHCLPAESKGDVDKIADEIERYEREAKSPPQVDERHGWSPYAAREFLSGEGLRTADLHELYAGGQWWAGSTSVKLSDEVLSSSASYYIEGVKELVNTLKLKASFDYDLPHEAEVERFIGIAAILLIRSETADSKNLRAKLAAGEVFEERIGRNLVRLAKEPYPFGTGFDLVFEIKNKTPG